MAETSNRIPPLDVSVTPKFLWQSSVINKNSFSLDQNIENAERKKVVKCSTPSYPSPIDRIQCGKHKRAEALGWTGWRNSSFEGNQSFPRSSRLKLRRDEIYPDTPPPRMTMERIRGDGLNTCSFSSGRVRGSFSTSRFSDLGNMKPIQSSNDLGSNIRSLQGFNDSAWSFSSSFVSALGGASNSFPTAAMNPNKAVFTIDNKSSKILVVNGMACSLLGFTPEELCQMKLHQLLSGQHKTQLTALSEEQLDIREGNMVILSGKVMEMVTKDEKIVPVSLWLRKLETEGRCLAVAEPVERRVAQLVMDQTGCIISADSETSVIFQYEEDDLEEVDIAMLIPAIKLPGSEEPLNKDVKKQKATGRTRDGATFPLCLKINEQMSEDKSMDNATNVLYSVVIWVFANMSGLVVITEEGLIESCNHHFTHMMFGYPQSVLLGQRITTIIPNFCEDLEYLGDTTVTLHQFDLNKTDDDNDNSNYDSALENTEHDKSKNSRKETATVELDRSSKMVESLGVELLAKGECCCTNVTANNSLASVGEILDSVNRLNFGCIKDNTSSSLSLYCSDESVKQGSIFTIGTSSVGKQSSPSEHYESSNAKTLPPKSLNIVASNAVLDIENGSENGELTPIVSPQNDFVDYDDNFETASDGEDDDESSIEVIEDGEAEGDLPVNKLKSNKLESINLPLKSFSGHNLQDSTNRSDVVVEVLGIHDNSDASGSDKENKLETSEGYGKDRNSESGVKYYEQKETGSLGVIKFDDADELSAIPDSADFVDEDNLDHTGQVMLMSSTPAIGKRLARKGLSKDLDNKGEAGTLKKFVDGSYVGFGRHRDGSSLDIVYRVRGMALSCGRLVYCVWVSRDPEEMGEGGRYCGGNLTLTSSFNSTVDNSLGQAIRSCAQSNVILQQQSTQPGSVSVLSQCDDDHTCGDYGEHYTTLQQIGKGAFGYVKMAFRNEDGLLVITKFIQKHKVHQQSWVEDPTLGRKVPLEISLLTTLKHPNIVQVLDVFENVKFFQLVMEKHGAGMDLFEFIDRKPYLDETLNSYIFRQIVSAVDYLHSLQILHRDIKDENVIINERFHAKLIDFGSATFMSEGRLFSTFYGTVEYCSPEVLAGNKYEGPELEMWSLGVTLYVMTFGENPFFDVEEIMRAELHPPCKVSDELIELLHWMLAKDPQDRCKVQQLVGHHWVNLDVDMSSYCFQDVVSCHPQEAHPPVYYAEYRCDSANDSLSNHFPITESSSAMLSNNNGDSNPDDRTVGSSNSLGSLTTVENFETEEDLHGQHQGHVCPTL
ncbi:PAS domain-containing serine/threonine-protein kinase isoform X4 [Zootermopsis nevadensis]|uniref:PAS domain-containing serine/threonine-protein kinase isoform X4 n=1 Tax=Zootermopsis nevadensis TaxID=136037 RepID=UPI000B8E4FCF|nr:PAS domain-containing serine/threonine-protein kinase isoform X4 [Zootermopsis nevadensis]